jgi:ferrous iron transport protein A
MNSAALKLASSDDSGFPFPAAGDVAWLDDAAPGQSFRVRRVVAPAGAPEWAGQLEDLGFIAGERVSLMARGQPGGEPLVVRIGLSTFALRRVEAACVQLAPVAA